MTENSVVIFVIAVTMLGLLAIIAAIKDYSQNKRIRKERTTMTDGKDYSRTSLEGHTAMAADEVKAISANGQLVTVRGVCLDFACSASDLQSAIESGTAEYDDDIEDFALLPLGKDKLNTILIEIINDISYMEAVRASNLSSLFTSAVQKVLDSTFGSGAAIVQNVTMNSLY